MDYPKVAYMDDHWQSQQIITMIIKEFNLSPTEEIFDDFKCTLRTASVTNGMTDIVGRSIGGLIEHVGHLYLTEEHICFSGNMFAETKLKLRFVDIQSIAKSKTLGIFDWAILIKVKPRDAGNGTQKADSYLFGAFENRDLAYKRMMDIWASHTPEAAFG